ncbi:MAG: DUF2752 domain-containing protein [Myxococcales bacterium]|nr:DUF2752 domain-containing protein [Myxococcales bacterium]
MSDLDPSAGPNDLAPSALTPPPAVPATSTLGAAEWGSRSTPPARGGSWFSRLGWLFLFAAPLAVVITATRLTPDTSGMGTHQQLGLPPCGFLVVTGIPCPGCGLTTSFAHMVRLQFTGAAHANPFGVMLFLVTFFTIPIAAHGLYRGTPVLDTLERLHAEKWAILLSVTSLLVWTIRVARHLLG